MKNKYNTHLARLALLSDMGTSGSVDLRKKFSVIFYVVATVGSVFRIR